MGVCFVPRFLPEVVPVSSLSTSRHLLASLGMMRGGPRLAGETGQGGGGLYGCNDTPPPCRASGEHLVDLRTYILTWRGPGRGSDPRCLGPFSLGRASWCVCSLLFRTWMHHAHTHLDPWPFVVSKMEIRGRGVVESLEIMPTSPQSRPSLPPCYPGAKPPFEIHGLVMRRRSVTVVDSSSKRLTLLWRLGPCLLRSTVLLGPAWRMMRPGDGPSASVMTFPWCPCGFRVDCIAELSAEESAEEMLVWSTTAGEGASGTQETASESRPPWFVRRSRPLQTAEALFASSPYICQRAAGIPRGSAISGLAILPNTRRAAEKQPPRKTWCFKLLRGVVLVASFCCDPAPVEEFLRRP